MTTTDTSVAKPAWHFWLVVLVGVVWNGFGGVDYTMSHVAPETWFRMMQVPPAVVAFMDTYPSWMHAVWAIGVWGSVLGTVLLLLRSTWAFHAFAVSILGALGNLAYTMATPGASEALGGTTMPLVIIVICAFYIWYAWTMTKRGVLR